MKIKSIISTSLVALGLSASASAATLTFAGGNMNNLDHYQAVTWGITPAVPGGQTVTGATLTITNIRNWAVETNKLFIHLLDSSSAGVSYINDDPWHTNAISDYFSGQGILLTTFIDTLFTPQTFTFTFNASQLTTLNQYIANGGNFALGLDADCHYWNDGVSLTLTTGSSNIPGTPDAGSSVALLGLALAGLAAVKRRFAV